jgi:hypothetical protein
MTTKRIVQFADPKENAPDPITATKAGNRIQPKVFDESLTPRTYAKKGEHWVRFLPPIQGSSFQWMMKIDVFEDYLDGVGNKFPPFVDPACYNTGEPNAFREAYNWFRKNDQDMLFNREKNPNGFKLTSKPKGIAWFIDSGKNVEDGDRLGMFYQSLYNGEWGGSAGLAFKLWAEANLMETEPDSDGYGKPIYGNIASMDAGRKVLIDKSKAEGAKFASYSLRIGKEDTVSFQKYLDMLTEEEKGLLQPLENTFIRLSYKEQLEILRVYIGEKYFSKIFVGESPTQAVEKQDEPTPDEPTPDKPTVPTPDKPTATEDEESTKERPFTISQVTKLINTKAGVEELMRNKHRLVKNHLVVVKGVCEEMGIPYEE